MENKINLTNRQYWDDNYNTIIKLEGENIKYPIVKKIYKYFSSSSDIKNKSILEIGCFPGRFLYHFGIIGYELNGVDISNNTYKLKEWYMKENFKIGHFEKKDIRDIDYSKKYDIVFSSGFIEHFKDFDNIIKIHTDLVNKGGYLYITTPNFAGYIQNILHRLLDKKNYNDHYIPSMNPIKWKKIIEEQNFNVVEYGYLGGFNFWIDNKNIIPRIISKIIRITLCWDFLPNTKAYSPEIYIIATKK